MNNKGIRNLCFASVLAAFTFVVTRFIQIPIPLGYFNVGNSVILLGCLFMPTFYGTMAGSIGSALADLTSYPVYTIPTLIIKALMPLAFYQVRKMPVKNEFVRDLLAFIVATLIPLVGYSVTGGILYGGFAAGLAQVPGLFLEYLANIAIYAVLYKPVRAIANRTA